MASILRQPHRSPAPVTEIQIADHTAPTMWRAGACWTVCVGALSLVLFLSFVAYSATIALAIGLTTAAVVYMVAVGRWVSHDMRRRDW